MLLATVEQTVTKRKRLSAAAVTSELGPLFTELWLHGECALWVPNLVIMGTTITDADKLFQNLWNEVSYFTFAMHIIRNYCSVVLNAKNRAPV
jgi:hypothetical protein